MHDHAANAANEPSCATTSDVVWQPGKDVCRKGSDVGEPARKMRLQDQETILQT